ncbi:MAG: hypothetical protein Q7S02_04445 [bacterium]|nr:hypothetical protein [bacterium]
MADLTQEHFEEYMDSFAKMVKEGFDATASKETTATKSELTATKAELKAEFKTELTATKSELTTEIRAIKAVMVTKDYLDEKMADLRGDLVVLMRKEDTKLKKLIEKLRARDVLSEIDVQEIVRMEPFAVLQP